MPPLGSHNRIASGRANQRAISRETRERERPRVNRKKTRVREPWKRPPAENRKSRRAKAQFRANRESKSAPRQRCVLELEIISRVGRM
jgi:hypothetical protein